MSLNDIQALIVERLMRFAKKSLDNFVVIYPELLFDAISYDIAEGRNLNCKRQTGDYYHQIKFMGFKFYTISEYPVYDSNDFFNERPAR